MNIPYTETVVCFSEYPVGYVQFCVSYVQNVLSDMCYDEIYANIYIINLQSWNATIII